MDGKKGITFLAISFVVLVSLSSFASALGVSLGPSRNNPLLLAPGESLSLPVNLQNVAGEEDVTVQLSVTNGGEIASTENKEYLLAAGSSSNYAQVLIEIPENAPIGSEYSVTLSLRTVTRDSGNGIAFGSALDISFPVRVVDKSAQEQPAPSRENLTAFFAVVIALIIVLWAILRYLRKKKK